MKPRSKLGPMVVVPLVISTAAPLASAQVDKTHRGVCVEPGDPGERDAAGHTVGDVVFDGAGYAMWYAGSIPGPLAQIGLAVSPGGINRGRYRGNPVMSPTSQRYAVNSISVMIEDDTIHGRIDHCGGVWYVTSPLEQVFFDHFETGEADIWSAVVPEPGGRSMPSPTGRASEPAAILRGAEGYWTWREVSEGAVRHRSTCHVAPTGEKTPNAERGTLDAESLVRDRVKDPPPVRPLIDTGSRNRRRGRGMERLVLPDV